MIEFALMVSSIALALTACVWVWRCQRDAAKRIQFLRLQVENLNREIDELGRLGAATPAKDPEPASASTDPTGGVDHGMGRILNADRRRRIAQFKQKDALRTYDTAGPLGDEYA